MILKSPFFSIVIPVFNGERYLADTLESVISQTEKDWELVIIDDCSKDQTPEILNYFKEKHPLIRTLRNDQNRDIAFSLNRGIEEARGQWIVRLDADDCFSNRYLEILRQEIEKCGEDSSVFFSAWVTVMDESSQKILSLKLPSADFIQRMMPYENFLYHPATSFSKEAWCKVGGYPMKTPVRAEDTAMWLRFFKAGMTLRMIPKALVNYRIHNANVTSAKDSCLQRHSSSKAAAMLKQGKEWRISLLLKQRKLKRARKEILDLMAFQKGVTPKNLNYLFMTFLPRTVVYRLMWGIRPRVRSWVRECRKAALPR